MDVRALRPEQHARRAARDAGVARVARRVQVAPVRGLVPVLEPVGVLAVPKRREEALRRPPSVHDALNLLTDSSWAGDWHDSRELRERD